MTHHEFLLTKAEAYWLADHPLPIDLFYQMLGAGIDVAAAEKSFNLTKEALHG